MNQIAPGVWQLAGHPPHWVNVYLVGDVLIDCGTRWARRAILRQLKGKSLSQIALTHCHPDHQGLAALLCRQFRAPLACHEADAPAVEGRSPMQPHKWFMRLGCWIMAGPPCQVRRRLKDGDDVAGFRVIHAPGHTPGHIFFFRESDRVVLAGDVLANISFLSGKPGLRLPPRSFSVDHRQNIQSVHLLAQLQPSIICFGHGPPLYRPDLLNQLIPRLTLSGST